MKRLFIKFMLLVMLAISCQGLAQEWRSLGLENEPITVITVDWSNPEVIYAGSGSNFSAGTVGGIFKTTNGGAAWDTLVRGVTVRDIDIHPKDPDILYATLGINGLTVAGIIKSLDAGETWFGTSTGLRLSWEEGPSELVIDPLYPDTLYTGTHGFGGGLPYKSTNGGMSWFSIEPDTGWVWREISPGDSILVDPLKEGIISIARHPSDTNHLFFTTNHTGDLLETRDGGKTWNTTGLIETDILLFDVEIDPYQTEHIYVGTSIGTPNSGILFSADGGHFWTNINNNLTATPISVSKVQFYLHDGTLDVYIIANWGDEGGIYWLDDNQQWRKVGIDGQRVSTMTIFNHNIYAGRSLENLGSIYTLDLLTSIENTKDTLPKDFSLDVFPNPAHSTITIAYQLKQTTPVRVEIFDILGRSKEVLLQKTQPAGEHQYAANLDILPSGIYFVRITTDRVVQSKKVIVLR